MIKDIILIEGITHLEDLSLKEFIRTIESFKNKVVTEKLDGANLWFGLDEKGVYTSREGKSAKGNRFRNVKDYPMVANNDSFRAAHLAIEEIASVIQKYFIVGDQAEIEVMFGRQPNTVAYGANNTNYIVIIRAVNGTPQERVDALSDALNGKTVNVESTIISSVDGNDLEFSEVSMLWKFAQVKPISNKKIDTKEVDNLLKQLKQFLSKQNNFLPKMTNQQVAEISLTSVDKQNREAVKKERERVLAAILNNYKLPIKELMLNNFVRKIKPFLQSTDLHPDEDIGVEGIVIRDPTSGEQAKIVDKDVFTAINTFNSSIRSKVGGLVRTTDQDSSLEMRGGIFGQAKIRIADLLGAKELSMAAGAKKFIGKFKGVDALTTATNLANSLQIKSVSSAKTKISAILTNAIEEIDSELAQFKKDAGSFKLKLKTDKEIGLSPEIMKRTLTAFAETKKDISEIKRAVLESKTAEDIILALYSRSIDIVVNGGNTEVKESFKLLNSINEDGDVGGEAPAAEVQMANPSAYLDTPKTASSNIAALPFKLMGDKKVITRRQRKFVKPKKFQMVKPEEIRIPSTERFELIKSVHEDLANVNDMKNATDVSDTAVAQNDVEFKRLRNNIVANSTNFTQVDVSNYLSKAHDINNSVDSITFGMETDAGDIIKVYVNAQQAEAFEEALAKLLGEEDDVEKVINLLSDKFDIVDVEWPKSYNGNNIEQEKQHQEKNKDEDAQIDLSISNNAEDEEIDQVTKNVKIKNEMEESVKSFGQKFKEKLLSEANESKNPKDDEEDPSVVAAQTKFSKQMEDLIAVFPSKNDRAIITLMINLGAPVKSLMLHKSELRSAIDSASEMYSKNGSFRMWTKKLLNAISSKVSMSESSDFDKKLSSKYQHLVYHILVALGMPESIEKSGGRQLLSGIRSVAKMAMSDSNVRIYLMSVADQLGVSDKVRHMSEPVIKEDVLNEDAEKAQATVMQLLDVLGIDTQTTRSIASQIIRPAVRTRIMKLSSMPSLVNKLSMIADMMKNKIVPKNALMQDFTASGNVVSESSDSWVMGIMGKTGGFMMKLNGTNIQLSDEESEKLSSGLALNKKTVTVVAKNGSTIVFAKEKNGYNVKDLENTKQPEGQFVSADEVKDIVEMLTN